VGVGNAPRLVHDVVGIACIEPALLEQRTNAYKAWVRRIIDKQGIPVLPAPHKEDFVQPFSRRRKGAFGGDRLSA
jgi:hypothetical protein